MKIILTLIALAFCLGSNAQSNQKVSYVSPKKDTLILPKDDLGKLIAQTWDNTKKKPTIIFADQSVIDNKNNRLQLVARKPNN